MNYENLLRSPGILHQYENNFPGETTRTNNDQEEDVIEHKMKMAKGRGEKGDGWEELAVPPEVVLGNQSSDGNLQEESANSDTVDEISDEAASDMKVNIVL